MWGIPLQPIRTLWRSCAEVREVIEMPFGVVSGVASGIGVLDGDIGLPREGQLFGTGWVGDLLVYWL